MRDRLDRELAVGNHIVYVVRRSGSCSILFARITAVNEDNIKVLVYSDEWWRDRKTYEATLRVPHNIVLIEGLVEQIQELLP